MARLLRRLVLESGRDHRYQPVLPGQPALLQQAVDGVEEGVDGRVDGQHEDGHGHVDLAGHADAQGGQHAQQPHGEPAQEVRHGHGEQAARQAALLAGPPRAQALCLLQAVLLHRLVDEELAHGDQHEEDEVEDDEQAEGVAVAGEVLARDGQRHADGVVGVEGPVAGVGQ